MQRLEVSDAVRPLCRSLGVKRLMMLQRYSIRTWIFYLDAYKHMAETGVVTVHIGRRMEEISYLWVFFTRLAV